MNSRATWAVMLSGRGSNAQALWEMLSELDVRLVISSRKKSLGLLKAKRLGIPSLVLESLSWDELTQELRLRRINRIFLLGFMKLLPKEFCEAWAGQIWNLHPSLLPSFPGAKAMERSFEAKGEMGVSIHQVTAEMDAGPLCLQKKIAENAQTEFAQFSHAEFRISQTEQRLVQEWARRAQFQGGCQWT